MKYSEDARVPVPHRQPSQVVVRMGQAQWVVGGDNRTESASQTAPSTTTQESMGLLSQNWGDASVTTVAEPVSRPKTKTPEMATGAPRHRVREGFQFGLIFGLALGCLGLVMFHQMPSAVQESSISSSAWPSTATLNGPSITIPGIRSFAIEVGTYADASAAEVAQTQLQKKGVSTVQYPDGTKKRVLIAGLAMRTQDLTKKADSIRHLGAQANVVQLSVPAKAESTLPSLTKSQGQALNHWLSDELSAMNALTASIADGEPMRDAVSAFAAAKQSQPTPQTLQSTGAGVQMNGVEQDVAQAFTLADKNNSSESMVKLMSAYGLLAQIELN